MTAPFRRSWIHLTRPYLEELAVYQCPDDASDNLTPVFLDPDSTAADQRITSYGINAYFTPNHPPYFGIRPWQITEPSRTIIAAELIESIRADHFMPMFWGDPPAVTGMMQTMQWDAATRRPKTVMHTRHFGEQANYIFADGHAAAHPFPDTWAQTPGTAPTRDWYDVRHD